MKQNVFMHNISVITSIGANALQNLQSILTSKKSFTKTDSYSPGVPTPIGLVKANLVNIPDEHSIYNSKNSRLSLTALLQIKDGCQFYIKRFGADRVALIAGSSTSGIEEGINAFKFAKEHNQLPEDFSYQKQEMGSVSEFLYKYLELNSFHYTVSTACSSSTKIIQSGRNALLSNLCDAVILVSADTISQLTVQGFQSLEAVSENESKPFSSDRNGINLGEGAAICILTKEPHPSNIQILGVGSSCDAHHMSAPHPDGVGAELAMRNALKDANLLPNDITYINSHGTGTGLNDSMESKAIHSIFGADTATSSTKALTGHTLGASGLIEACFCWLLLSDLNHENLLPYQSEFKKLDPSMPMINILNASSTFKRSSHTRMLSNSFAFGGNNCSIILEKDNCE